MSPSYQVQAGDTFNAIAAKLNLTPQSLEAENPTVNPTDLQTGQWIKIAHTVVPGNTYDGISSTLHCTTGLLQTVNPGINPSDLQIGQFLQLPSASGT